MTSVVALGDSFTCGQGVGLRVAPSQTWVALLTDSLPKGHLVSLATPGARVRDVLLRQLGHVGEARLASLLIGLNDVARSGFTPPQVREDLLEAVQALTGSGAEVLLGRLHDPTEMLWLPAGLVRAVQRRVGVVNAAIDEAGRSPGVHLLDLADAPVLGTPSGWAVDRVHPSILGHRGIAAAAARLLAAAGWQVAPLPDPERSRGPSRTARSWWTLRYGMPYAAGNLAQFGPPVLSGLLRRG